MRASALTGLAAAATALAVVLSGCGSDTKTATSSSEKTTASSSEKTSTSKSATTKPKVAPRDEDAAGPHETIASYIKENDIQETQVRRGDPGSPTIDLPVPEGWDTAGADTPEWAYGAIVYTGPESAEYTPSIVAIVSKLSGNVDPQKILDLAPGELQNLSGYEPLNEGATSTLGEYPAFQLGGTWVQDGQKKIVAQKTVVIPGSDGLYVLQLNADGLEDQMDIVSAATDVIDSGTTITP
ncbi:LpqN/LpqT family lipoprotein [Mycolicibacterium cosmeticum]|uniref:LpqN/LpqT family lipoprotein n=1 Tax=Mycolicibacterium cosmeticum TaxID=258533 RepID=UPI0032046BC4